MQGAFGNIEMDYIFATLTPCQWLDSFIIHERRRLFLTKKSMYDILRLPAKELVRRAGQASILHKAVSLTAAVE